MYLKKQSARCFQYSVTYRATWRSHHGQVIGGTIGSLLLTALSSMVPRESIDTTTSTGRRGVYTKTGMGSQRSPPYAILERALDVTPQAVVCQQLVMDALFLASAPERRDDPNRTDAAPARSIPASRLNRLNWSARPIDMRWDGVHSHSDLFVHRIEQYGDLS